MESSKERYIPALGYHRLTPLYDPMVALSCRERTFRGRLLAQADIRPGHTVLDLGCGTGTFAVQIKRATPEATVVGIDGDATIPAVAAQKAQKARVAIDFRQCLSTDLPFADGTFDRVVSSLFFHHLTTAQKCDTAREALRVLQDGGELHLADWGQPANALTRVLFFAVQLLDGLATTRDHAQGRLPAILQQGGFGNVTICNSISTVLGTMSLYRAHKLSKA
jgi:ubiquinone/menaquinone biosynthesis C-methylase UbiE